MPSGTIDEAPPDDLRPPPPASSEPLIRVRATSKTFHMGGQSVRGLLGIDLEPRTVGEGWQTASPGPAVGVHERGRGPGDSFSLPYFSVEDIDAALDRVKALGGTVVHPGSRWAICKDSEGSPFALAASEPQA